jgi:drug/metabolite transporter (DMT)-like permease
VVGQKHSPPIDAAIILSMEAVFGALFGLFFLGELMSMRQISGCGMILVSMILAQVKSPTVS